MVFGGVVPGCAAAPEQRTQRLQEIEANRLERQAKRRLQRAQQTQNFYKSIHMQQANALLRESDSSSAFEDYSLYLYRQSAPVFNDRVRELELKLRYPDRERDLAAAYPRGLAEGVDQFSDRVRSMEQRIGGRAAPVVEKKPKDLLRAIGKIDSSDWNVKEIERKIELSKKATDIGKSRERNPNALLLSASGVAEKCHFCKQRVYLMEKISAEGLTLHRSCLKCHHCHTNLRLGAYAFDRDAPEGRFYCTPHFKLPSKTLKPTVRKSTPRQRASGPLVGRLLDTAAGLATGQPSAMVDGTVRSLLADSDRASTVDYRERRDAHTPERVSDEEANMEVIDENEWTDRNFGTESDESDEELSSSSDDSDTESDSEYGETADSPLGAQTLQLAAEWISDKRFLSMVDSDADFYSYSSEEDDDAESQTEGEELARAREMRRQEVNLLPAPIMPTDTETERTMARASLEHTSTSSIAQTEQVFASTPPTASPSTGTQAQAPQLLATEAVGSTSLPEGGERAPADVSGCPVPESADVRALKERMLKKLSVREQWLHAQASPERSQTPDDGLPCAGASGARGSSTAGDSGGKTKSSTSFFGGLMNSLSTLIKPKSQNSPPPPPPSPPQPTATVHTTAITTSMIATPTITTTTTTSTRQGSQSLASASLPLPVPPSSVTSNTPPAAGTVRVGTARTPAAPVPIPASPAPSLQQSPAAAAVPPTPPTPKHRRKVSKAGASLRGSEAELDRLIQEASGAPMSSCGSQCSSPALSARGRRPSSSVDEADEFLRQIKEEQAELDKRSKQQEARKFQTNMQSIRSAVDGGPKVVGVKSEKDAARFFAGNRGPQRAGRQLPNKDVTALQGAAGASLAKYFPGRAAGASATTGTPTSVSSVEGSPALGRKKPSETDLLRYFGPSAGGKSNASSSTPPSSLVSPAISRKSSIESPLPVRKSSTSSVVMAPKPPVAAPPPKKNILAFQPIKKSKTDVAVASLEPPPPPRKSTPGTPKPKSAAQARPKVEPPASANAARTSPDVDEQLFEDLLQDVDDALVDTFDAILGESRSNKSSPKGPRKERPAPATTAAASTREKPGKAATKASATSVDANERYFTGTVSKPQSAPASVPKLTIKRPAFKIEIPVKMQETLEEIYLASLSKLDTRSSSLIDLTATGETLESGGGGSEPIVREQQLGRVNEEPEEVGERQRAPNVPAAPVSLRSGNDSSDKLTLQPFQAQQRTKTAASAAAKPKAEATEPPTKATAKQKKSGSAGQAAKSPPGAAMPSTRAIPAVTGPQATATAKKTGTPSPPRKAISSVQISLKQQPSPAAPSHPTAERSTKQPQQHASSSPARTEQGASGGSPTLNTTNQINQTQAVGGMIVPKRDTGVKSAFAVVSKDALRQGSAPASPPKHRTSPLHEEQARPAVANGIPAPSMNSKQQHSTASGKANVVPQLTAAATSGNQDSKPVVAPDESVIVPPPRLSRSRTLSSDEKCFDELRRKHEALFASQEPPQPASEPEPPSVPVPKTLAELRSTLLFTSGTTPSPTTTTTRASSGVPGEANAPTSVVEPIAPQYRDGINQLVMELMPGASIEQVLLLDDLPVPRQRQKTSFRKEFNKLQRANSIATADSTKVAAPATPASTEYRMEVIREAPVQQRSGKPIAASTSNIVERLGSEEKMQIRLERSAQIREQYAVRKPPPSVTAWQPPPAKANVAVGSTAKRKNSAPTEVTDFDELLDDKLGEDSASLAADVDLDELLQEGSEREGNAPVKTGPQVVSKSPLVARSHGGDSGSRNLPATASTVQGTERSASKNTGEAAPAQSAASGQQLTSREFNAAVSQLTEKFAESRKPSPKEKEPSGEQPKGPKKDALAGLLDKAKAAGMAQTDLGILKQEVREKPKVDLISLTAAPSEADRRLMPDVVVSSTQKPQAADRTDVASPAPMKILGCMEALKSVTMPVVAIPPATIQVYTLHTTEEEPGRGTQPPPQPSTQGMSGDYAHILRDITSGLVGADFAAPVVYEPPARESPQRERTDFQAYKQLLAEKASRDEPIAAGGGGRASPCTGAEQQPQPQRPLRRQKKVESSESTPPRAGRAFDNSICIDPWRARKSASIENVAIEQVFVKRDEQVVDTFFVVPDAARDSHEGGGAQRRGSTKVRRSKSCDRLAVPGAGGRRGSLRQGCAELRDYDYDVESPGRGSRRLVDPRLRHLDLDPYGSDEELASLRGQPGGRWRGRKNHRSMTDVARREAVEPPKVDIDRESPRPRTTDFSKWEAILDRGVTYYEGGAKSKPDVRTLEKRIEDLEVRRARPLRRKAIPKDYDPDEYVPRINRRGPDSVDPTLPRDYDPDEYVPKPMRGGQGAAHSSPPVQPLPRSYDPDEYIPRANRREPAFHEVPVPIQRAPPKYLKEPPPYHYQYPPEEPLYYGGGGGGGGVSSSVPLGRSKTTAHVPLSSRAAYDLPARDIARSQYARRYDAEDRHIVDRSHRLHEKTNKYIRTQVTRNDPNPYIREMLEHDSEDEDAHPVASSGAYHHHPPPQHHYHHRVGTVGSSYASGSTYGTSGAAAMSRIQTKAITQPSRMLHYTGRQPVVSSASASGAGAGAGARLSYDHHRRRAGDSSRTRENCNIS
uniref:Uncharacterized protein n=1 Tax=Anopheles atroparvus TaxID=41427 RepID=A0A182JGE5_ANOAO